ncbi:MAG: replication-associated recombination protein A [Solitalea-like symbiont of Acarus siro]
MKGKITLIGATTENPSFEIINPLLSRCNIYVLQPLTDNDLIAIINNAVKNDIILSKLEIEIIETSALLQIASHDARKLLNILESTINIQGKNSKIIINNETVVKAAGHKVAIYDKNGEYHYDIISAFIKSIRGSDPNAAIFWLACMLNGGEDIKFIARRLIILASEDIGNANPMALVVANNCFQAVNVVGMPEARIILGQCTTYLASSSKSNASYRAIDKALSLTKNNATYTVPVHLRNAPTKLMKDLNYGKDYKYSHSYDNNFVDQEYLPTEISGTLFYEPQDNDIENSFRLFLKNRWGKKYNY